MQREITFEEKSYFIQEENNIINAVPFKNERLVNIRCERHMINDH